MSFMDDGYYSTSNTNFSNDTYFELDYQCPLTDVDEKGINNHDLPSLLLDSPSTLSSEKTILFDKFNEAQQEIKELSAKLNSCQNEITLVKSCKRIFQTDYQNLKRLANKTLKEELLQKVIKMSDEVSALLLTHDNLVERFNKQENSLKLMEIQCNMLKEENKQLNLLNESLKTKCSEDGLCIERLQFTENEMQTKLNILTIENKALSNEYEQTLKELRKEGLEFHGLEEEVIELKKMLNTSNNELKQTKEESLDLNGQISTLNEEIKCVKKSKHLTEQKLLREISSNEMDKSVLVAESKSLKNELVKEKDVNKTHEEQIKRLSQINNGMRNLSAKLLTQYAKILKENENLKSKSKLLMKSNEDLQANNATLMNRQTFYDKEKIDTKEHFQKINNELYEKLKNLEAEVNAYQNENVQLKCYYSNEKVRIVNNHQTALQALNNNVNELESQNSKLRCKLKGSREQCSSYKKRAQFSEEKIAEYKADIDEMASKNDELLKKCRSLETSIYQHKQQSEDYCNVIDDVKIQYAKVSDELVNESQQVENLTKKLQVLTNENEQLKKINQDNLDLIKTIGAQSKKELLREKKESNAKISSMEIHVKELEEAIKTLKSENLALQNESAEKLLTATNKCESELIVCNRQKEILEQENQSLKNDIFEKNEEVSRLTESNRKLNISMSELHEEIKKCQIDYPSAEKLKGHYQETIHKLQQELKQLNATHEELLVEHKDWVDHTKELQQKLVTQEKEAMVYTSQKRGNIAVEQKLKKELYESSRRNEFLKMELSQSRSENHSISNNLNALTFDFDSIKNEIHVVTELNKKLEEVNERFRQEKNQLKQENNQLQMDMQTLKKTFEEILNKELEKQQSKYILRENDLLKKFSSIN